MAISKYDFVVSAAAFLAPVLVLSGFPLAWFFGISPRVLTSLPVSLALIFAIPAVTFLAYKSVQNKRASLGEPAAIEQHLDRLWRAPLSLGCKVGGALGTVIVIAMLYSRFGS